MVERYGFLGGAHSYVQATGILRGNEQVKELDYTTDAFGREAMSRVLMESHLPMNLFPAAGFKNHARTWTAALFDFAPGGRGLPQ